MLSKGQMYLQFDKKLGVLRPDDDESRSRFQKLALGETYLFEFKRVRNYSFLKKYFKLMETGFNNQDKFTDSEWFRTHTLIGIGHCETKIDPFTGAVHMEAKSISFSKCNETAFGEIYEKTVSFFVERYGYDEKFVETVMGYL
jgi:hypothetical protein